MSLEENQDSVKLDLADQEIPDRATAQAAEWLSVQNVGFDTSTFWLVAGLLKLYAAAERDAEREQCCRDVCEVCRNPNYHGPSYFKRFKYEAEMWWHMRNLPSETEKDNVLCAAAPIRSRVAAKESQ